MPVHWTFADTNAGLDVSGPSPNPQMPFYPSPKTSIMEALIDL